jgi:hypothetical protein
MLLTNYHPHPHETLNVSDSITIESSAVTVKISKPYKQNMSTVKIQKI